MPLNPEKLRRELFSSGPSDARTSRAWKVYQNESYDDSVRGVAQSYLVRYFFQQGDSVSTDPIELNKRLIELMALETLKKHSSLTVNDGSKKDDVDFKISYFSEKEREKFRVIVKDGMLINFATGMLYDTTDMQSHDKKEFASFTLNHKGEISAFNHLDGEENEHGEILAHSSMNAGQKVAIAGEIEVKDGELLSITTHSGHYAPSIFNVYYILDYLSKLGIDIRKTQVLTFHGLPPELSENCKRYDEFELIIPPIDPNHPNERRAPDPGVRFSTPATDVYDKIKLTLESSIKTINSQIDSYTKAGFYSRLLRFKDSITGSTLTEDRAKLAKTFLEDINKLQDPTTPGDYHSKYDQLMQKIEEFSQSNNTLSETKSKKKNTGRLSELTKDLKDKLQEIKKDVELAPLEASKVESFRNKY